MIFVLTSCAYHLGDRGRALPGGYDQLAIPVFSNRSDEVSIETYFTNALRREFERSRVAKLMSKDDSPLTLEGEIRRVDVLPSVQIIQGNSTSPDFPVDTVLNTENRITLTVNLRLRRKSDQRIIWEQAFSRERVYSAPRVTLPFINSADPLYNQSSRLQTISRLADEMMEEAHDSLTENF